MGMVEYLTKQGLEKLKKELEYLKKVKRREIAKQLKYAASFGDLSENAAYHQAKDEKAFAEGRILELEKILVNARVIDDTAKTSGKAQIGSKVTIQTMDARSKKIKENLQIVGPQETDPLKNKISYKSPLGKALCGKAAGDTVEFETPANDKLVYKILEVN